MIKGMPAPLDIAISYASGVAEALAETLWPTRCAVCETPGEVLCATCRHTLPYLDWWRACIRCGAPFGRVQCSECNPVMLARAKRDEPPFEGCVSAVVFDERTARIVRTYKDQGERRLAKDMATLMVRSVPPLWDICGIVFIPASSAARRRRGFDHAELLAQHLAKMLKLPCIPALARPSSRDQRALSRSARLENMAGRFNVLPGASIPASILLIDDVYTTGATLFDATDALKRSGAKAVYCLTFARVW